MYYVISICAGIPLAKVEKLNGQKRLFITKEEAHAWAKKNSTLYDYRVVKMD